MTTLATNIKRARKHRGLTMEQLAEMAKCSKQSISNYENGLREPDSITLRALASALNFDVDYFYEDEALIPVNLLKICYRDGDFLSERERKNVEDLTRERLKQYFELEFIANEQIKFENPIAGLKISNFQDAEKAAKNVRKKWKLGEDPVHNITDLLEKKGIRVLKIDFGFQYPHEGLSGWANEDIPVIIINDKPQNLARIRFTILHELGHLLLEFVDSIENNDEFIEKLCNSFAGAVLLPSDALFEELGTNRTSVSMLELRKIKEKYGISIQAIMLRAFITKLISKDSYNNWLRSDLSNEDHGYFNGTEEPQRFMQILYRCLSEKLIGLDKAAQFTSKEELRFKDFYEHQIEF